jgi:hypothetical protein
MSNDPRRIIVTESRCPSCSVHTVHVHHQNFPEFHVEDLSAERAAGHLANRLQAALNTVSDPSHHEAIVRALADAQAFLDREGYAHPGRDVSGPHQS